MLVNAEYCRNRGGKRRGRQRCSQDHTPCNQVSPIVNLLHIKAMGWKIGTNEVFLHNQWPRRYLAAVGPFFTTGMRCLNFVWYCGVVFALFCLVAFAVVPCVPRRPVLDGCARERASVKQISTERHGITDSCVCFSGSFSIPPHHIKTPLVECSSACVCLCISVIVA